jgi:hypothetical protein
VPFPPHLPVTSYETNLLSDEQAPSAKASGESAGSPAPSGHASSRASSDLFFEGAASAPLGPRQGHASSTPFAAGPLHGGAGHAARAASDAACFWSGPVPPSPPPPPLPCVSSIGALPPSQGAASPARPRLSLPSCAPHLTLPFTLPDATRAPAASAAEHALAPARPTPYTTLPLQPDRCGSPYRYIYPPRVHAAASTAAPALAAAAGSAPQVPTMAPYSFLRNPVPFRWVHATNAAATYAYAPAPRVPDLSGRLQRSSVSAADVRGASAPLPQLSGYGWPFPPHTGARQHGSGAADHPPRPRSAAAGAAPTLFSAAHLQQQQRRRATWNGEPLRSVSLPQQMPLQTGAWQASASTASARWQGFQPPLPPLPEEVDSLSPVTAASPPSMHTSILPAGPTVSASPTSDLAPPAPLPPPRAPRAAGVVGVSARGRKRSSARSRSCSRSHPPRRIALAPRSDGVSSRACHMDAAAPRGRAAQLSRPSSSGLERISSTSLRGWASSDSGSCGGGVGSLPDLMARAGAPPPAPHRLSGAEASLPLARHLATSVQPLPAAGAPPRASVESAPISPPTPPASKPEPSWHTLTSPPRRAAATVGGSAPALAWPSVDRVWLEGTCSEPARSASCLGLCTSSHVRPSPLFNVTAATATQAQSAAAAAAPPTLPRRRSLDAGVPGGFRGVAMSAQVVARLHAMESHFQALRSGRHPHSDSCDASVSGRRQLVVRKSAFMPNSVPDLGNSAASSSSARSCASAGANVVLRPRRQQRRPPGAPAWAWPPGTPSEAPKSE